jgi:hypothetical protein
MIDIPDDTNFYDAVDMALNYAQQIRGETSFFFKGILLHVQPTSHKFDLETIYHLKNEIRRLKGIN